MKLYNALCWILLAFVVIDAVETTWWVSRGGEEATPIVARVIDDVGSAGMATLLFTLVMCIYLGILRLYLEVLTTDYASKWTDAYYGVTCVILSYMVVLRVWAVMHNAKILIGM